MKARIIAVGTELTIGQVLDTNSHFLAGALDDHGVAVERIIAIPDCRETMLSTFQAAIEQVDITIVTGGLGPTEDDFTKEVLLELFGGELREDPATLEQLIKRYERRGVALSERNREQALLPTSCTPIVNPTGTAPGMRFERGGHALFSLPGVPFEMQTIFTQSIAPWLERQEIPPHTHRTLQVYGIAESDLADRLKEWEHALPDTLSLAYLPSPESIRLRISAEIGAISQQAKLMVDQAAAQLKELLGNLVFGEEDDTLVSVLGAQLADTNTRVAVAESCTAGGLAARMASVPGASKWLAGGFITYTSAAKHLILGIDTQLLREHGPVSEPVAVAMARATKERLNAEYGVAITGLLGPEGDGSQTPVGTVWIAVFSAQEQITKKLVLQANRVINAHRAISEALNLLRLQFSTKMGKIEG